MELRATLDEVPTDTLTDCSRRVRGSAGTGVWKERPSIYCYADLIFSCPAVMVSSRGIMDRAQGGGSGS